MSGRWFDLSPVQRERAPVLYGMPFPDYLALTSVHFSTLKAMDTSALHYAHAVKHDRRDTSALRLGKILHAMILDPTPPDVAIYEGKTRQGAAWKSFEAEHAGKTILRRGELEGAASMRTAILAHPVASGLVTEGDGEVTLQWAMLGHPCRGRLDWLRPCGSPVELKTTRKIQEQAFARDYAAYRYHAQQAFYWGGLTAARGGKEPPELPYVIAVENQAPYDVDVYRVGYDVIEAGQRKIDEWITKLDACRKGRRWPGVCEAVKDLKLPEWTLNEGLEVDMNGIEGEHGSSG